eukprot:CFRG6549T1
MSSRQKQRDLHLPSKFADASNKSATLPSSASGKMRGRMEVNDKENIASTPAIGSSDTTMADALNSQSASIPISMSKTIAHPQSQTQLQTEAPQQSFSALLEGMKKLKQTHFETDNRLIQQNDLIGEYKATFEDQKARLTELQKRCGQLERKLQIEIKSREEVLRKIQNTNTLCFTLKDALNNLEEIILKGAADKDDIKRELKKDKDDKSLVESAHEKLAEVTAQFVSSQEFVSNLETEMAERSTEMSKLRTLLCNNTNERQSLQQEQEKTIKDLRLEREHSASLSTKLAEHESNVKKLTNDLLQTKEHLKQTRDENERHKTANTYSSTALEKLELAYAEQEKESFRSYNIFIVIGVG